MTNYTEQFEVEFQDQLFLLDAEFDVEVETYIAEPYSWGQSRGTETDVLVHFEKGSLEGMGVDRKWAEETLKDTLYQIEQHVAETHMENM